MEKKSMLLLLTHFHVFELMKVTKFINKLSLTSNFSSLDKWAINPKHWCNSNNPRILRWMIFFRRSVISYHNQMYRDNISSTTCYAFCSCPVNKSQILSHICYSSATQYNKSRVTSYVTFVSMKLIFQKTIALNIATKTSPTQESPSPPNFKWFLQEWL